MQACLNAGVQAATCYKFIWAGASPRCLQQKDGPGLLHKCTLSSEYGGPDANSTQVSYNIFIHGMFIICMCCTCLHDRPA